MAGIDVAGSPAPGIESPGTTYTLAAGTYQVSEDAFSGYAVSYSGDSDSSGNITLAPGDNKTVTISNDDVPVVGVTETVTGGQLPKTSTYLYELLFGGSVLILLGAIGWRSRKRLE